MAANPLEPVTPPSNQPAAPTASAEPTNLAFYQKTGGDWTKAETTYFNAVNELKRVHDSAAAIAAENERLKAAVSTITGAPGGQPANDDPLAVLQDQLGLPIEPFQRAITAAAEKIVDGRLGNMFNPLLQEMQADEALAALVPNYVQVKADAKAFLAANPEVDAVFKAVRAADPKAAWQYAIQQSLIASGSKPNPPASAGLPGSMTPQGRGPANQGGPTQATREAEALEYGRTMGGSMDHYRTERFKGTSVERAVRAAAQQMGIVIPGEPGSNPAQGW